MLVRFSASAFFRLLRNFLCDFVNVDLVGVVVVGLPSHAGAGLFYHRFNLESRCRPQASSFAGGAPLSGQPANMRRPIAVSTKSVFIIFVLCSISGLYA